MGFLLSILLGVGMSEGFWLEMDGVAVELFEVPVLSSSIISELPNVIDPWSAEK